MKKQLLVIILLQIALGITLQAQENHICGTPNTPSKWTDEYLRNRNAYAKSNELLYAPLTIHVVGNDDGSGYLRLQNILEALCSLNEDFAPANIQFYIKDSIRYINNSDLYNLDGSRNLFRSYRDPNSINCFLVNRIGSSGSGTILGFADGISSISIVLITSVIRKGNPTLPHEIGHALGLYHTFYGWEGFDHVYSLKAPDTVNYERAVERVDGFNCEISGDGICDTSPDYLNSTWSCDVGGQSNIQQKDPTGATFRSDGTNFMTYASDNCQNRFTTGQIEVMRTNLTTVKRNSLYQEQPLPSIDPLPPTLLHPLLGETVAFDSVALHWQEIPNATKYVVEVSRLSNFASTVTDIYVIDTNTLPLTNLVNNRTYFWRVSAYNRNSFCGERSATATFRAATLTTTTDVNDLPGKASFNVFPNPLAEKQLLTIESNLPENMRLNVRLFDLSGKLLQTAAYDAIAGENKLSFTPGNLPKGVYVLNMITDNINVVKRIVIQ